MPDELFNPQEKVRILLTEYTSLRSQITAQMGQGFQASGFGVAALSLLAIQGVNWRTIIVFVLIACLLSGTGLIIIRDIWRAATRVRQIEQDVNNRVGENLLIWETLWGDAPKATFFDRPQSN